MLSSEVGVWYTVGVSFTSSSFEVSTWLILGVTISTSSSEVHGS